MKRNVIFYAAIFLMAFGFTSCDPDDVVDEVIAKHLDLSDDGVFITNEGPFGAGTGTVSFYSKTQDTLFNNVYQTQNDGAVLGNILQSMSIIDNKAYFLVNNAQKIEVVSASDLKYTSTITGLIQPRFMVGVGSGKAYVSQWGTGFESKIAVIDLASSMVDSEIDLAHSGAENMVTLDGKVYVTNSGGYGVDSTVTVIDVATEALSDIVVGDNPNGIQVDKNNAIWVISKGITDYTNTENNTNGSLVKLVNNEVVADFELPNSATDLEINGAGDILYYRVNNLIYMHAIDAVNTAVDALVESTYYGIGVDPDNGSIYAGDAGDFATDGSVTAYKANGEEIFTKTVGIIPSGFCFK